MDEAGQSPEPSVLIPWTKYLNINGQVVLAGDPNQLGPVVQSSLGRYLGLQLSMIERLMDFKFYQRDSNGNYNNKFVIQLTKNYRSHSKLLEVPNQLFYDNRLGESYVSFDHMRALVKYQSHKVK